MKHNILKGIANSREKNRTKTFLAILELERRRTGAYSEHSRTSKLEIFAKILEKAPS